ncbi:MAG: FlaD/FlaE family flagellar protein [Candidatus Methanoperedens sp.]|nr:FlaD/FlaE family flagellar protein [Candidatus Methanoperedens sp.]
MEQEIEYNEEKTLGQWLMFMLERVGHNNLSRLLDHYENLGWISMDVSDKLVELAETQKQRYVGPSWTLSAEEHRISMLYIEKLQGKPVEIPLLSAITQIKISQTKAKPLQPERETVRESYIESHRLEKNELEFAVQRREVTITNLEDELEKRDLEIGKLKDIIQELEYQLNEYLDEIKKNRIYKGILEENIRLKKVEFRNNI